MSFAAVIAATVHAAPEISWSVMHPTAIDTNYMARVAAKGEIDLDGKRILEGTSVLLPPGSTCELFGSDSVLFLTRFRV